MSESAKPRRRTSGRRKFAEWVSLGASALLVAMMTGFLLYKAVVGNGPIIPAEARVRLDQVGRAGQRYVVPVELHNRGERTMRDAKFEVTHRPGPDGNPHAQDFTIDYLGERSSQTVYIYFNDDPARLDLRADVLHYRLE